MSDTSRRAVMASIATASVASAGAIATPAVINPATDPIFAAIERHRVAAAAYAMSDPNSDHEGDWLALAEDEDALEALLTTRPTTAALRSCVMSRATTPTTPPACSVLRTAARRSCR